VKPYTKKRVKKDDSEGVSYSDYKEFKNKVERMECTMKLIIRRV